MDGSGFLNPPSLGDSLSAAFSVDAPPEGAARFWEFNPGGRSTDSMLDDDSGFRVHLPGLVATGVHQPAALGSISGARQTEPQLANIRAFLWGVHPGRLH